VSLVPGVDEPAEARLTVLSGPSGVGKGTVAAAVRHRHPDVWISVSVTTREPRRDEVEGLEYHFLDRAQFEEMVAAGELLEHAQYAGNWYGTPKRPILHRLGVGKSALLEIELQGMRQVRKLMPDAQFVFLAPPSFEELERRLAGRGTEPEEIIRQRLDQARIELASEFEFDVTVVNDSVERAADELVTLIEHPVPRRRK
jgi:guanylate kinase